MRDKKLSPIASNSTYSSGPFAGSATQVLPPVGAFSDGKMPEAKWAAQWQNYIESAIQKQVDRSARLPFGQFQDVTPGLSVNIADGTGPYFFAYNKEIGATLIASRLSNQAQYLQEIVELNPSTDDIRIVVFTATAGNFVPRCVASVDDLVAPFWIVGGSASLAPDKTIHEVTVSGTTLASVEKSLPTIGTVENIAIDATTGIAYALVADSDRSVLVRNMSTGVWSLLGIRGGSAQSPSAGSTFFAANNGELVIGYTATNAHIEYINVSPFTRTVRQLDAHGTAVLDVIWSAELGAWSLLTTGTWYTFAEPDGALQSNKSTVNNPSLFTSASGGCLTSTGCVTWVALLERVYVRDWPGERAQVFKFGHSGTTCVVGFARYDGSAIWLYTDRLGIDMKLYRSLRSL